MRYEVMIKETLIAPPLEAQHEMQTTTVQHKLKVAFFVLLSFAALC
jgi:hypothetical protein